MIFSKKKTYLDTDGETFFQRPSFLDVTTPKNLKSLLVMKSKEIHEKKDKRVENWKVKKTDISLNAEIVSLEQDEISLTLFS